MLENYGEGGTENAYALRYCNAQPFPHPERGEEGFVAIADLRVKTLRQGARLGSLDGWKRVVVCCDVLEWTMVRYTLPLSWGDEAGRRRRQNPRGG